MSPQRPPRSFIAASLFAFVAISASVAATAHAADAPRLSSIVIDGSLAEWSNRGLHIENLASPDGTPAPAGTRAHLGWDAQGLLFAIEIADTVITEAPVDLYTADSVELFVARGVGQKDRLQILFAPGLNPPLPTPRVAFEDNRQNKTTAPQIESARVASATGYILEARVPWTMLGWAPTLNATLGLQLIVNDADSDASRRKWTWHPGVQSSSDPRQLNEVRLAETAGPAERTIWRWTLLAPNRVSVVVSTPDSAGTSAGATPRMITAREHDRLVAQLALLPAPDSTLRRAEFILTTRGEDIALFLDEQPLGVLPLKSQGRPDPVKIARADYSLVPAVFSGNAFPELRLSKPADVENLLGPVTLSLRYFGADQREVTAPSRPGRYGVVYEIRPSTGAPIIRHQTLFRLPSDIDWQASPLSFASILFPAETGLTSAGQSRHSRDLAYLFNNAWRTHLATTPDVATVLAAIHEAGPDDEPATSRTSAYRLNRDWWTRLRQQLGQWEQYDHVVHSPAGYDADSEKRWPLVLFLHGSGDGENRRILQKWGPTRQISQGRQFPFILVAPRSPSGPWQGWDAPQLGALLDEIETKYRVDKNRVYVTGLSMGGFGTWRLASEFPERFAALAPFCGGADVNEAHRVAHIPTWAFHGDRDTAVPVYHTLRMIEAIRKAGGDPRMTIYPGVGHQCWEEAYSGQEFYDWLLSHRRSDAVSTP